VTPEQVAEAVSKVLADNCDVLQERRYTFNSNILVGKVGTHTCVDPCSAAATDAEAAAHCAASKQNTTRHIVHVCRGVCTLL